MNDRHLPGPWTFGGTQRHDGRDAWCWRTPDGQTLLVVPAFSQTPGTPTPMSLVGYSAAPYHSDGAIRVRLTPTVLIERVRLPYPTPEAAPALLDALLQAQQPAYTREAYAALTALAEAWCLATAGTWAAAGQHLVAKATLSDDSWTLDVSIGGRRERPRTRILPPDAAAFFRPVDVRRILVFPEVPDRPQTAHDRMAAAAWVEQTRHRLLAAFDAAAWPPKEEMRRQFLRDLAKMDRWAS
jgi:hypothetical protein